MKKNVRKALAISGLAIAIGTTGLTLEASAKTANSGVQRSVHQRIARTVRTEKTLHKTVFKRTVPGVVTEVSDSKITMKSGNKTYTINLSDSTRILDRKWQTLDLAKIEQNHKIRVFGNVGDATVTAQTVRDITLPAETN